ncbi:MAG: HEAT repeat domain-containing protein [Planctomycetes bacterium]|nr:HEAT repeat domain-containing protein [Planctomycetota bacterium]
MNNKLSILNCRLFVFVAFFSILFFGINCANAKIIEVSPSKFSEIYPAMWFSPSTGEIAAITVVDEKPPAPKFEVWIEPGDPEFAFLNSSDKGFVYLGIGDEVFKNPDIPKKFKLNNKLHHLIKPKQVLFRPVYLCKGKKGNCIIQIINFDDSSQKIRFKWRPASAGSDPDAVLALLFKEGTPEPNDVEIKAIYGILYQRMLKQIDLDGIKKLVEQLGSDDKAVRNKALQELEKRVRLKQPVIESPGSIFPMTGTPAQVWGKYAENLEVAVNVKIPLIIKDLRSSMHKSMKRYEALVYLGENCPHPAFLPILKAIALDKKEGLGMTAIRSIAAIPHKGMIDFLIDRLTAKPIVIALNTYERLQALAGAPNDLIVYFDVKKSWEGVDWESTKKNYKKWWKKHKDGYDFSKRLPPMQHVGGM